jgi:hypothetical protein
VDFLSSYLLDKGVDCFLPSHKFPGVWEHADCGGCADA